MKNSIRGIYTSRMIVTATFFGGPLAAGLLISKNYKTLGNEDAARDSVFLGITITIILIVGLVLLPEYMTRIFQVLISVAGSSITAVLVEKLQGAQIRAFLANNGAKSSPWQAAGYGLIGCLLMAGFLFITVLFSEFPNYDKSVHVNNFVMLHYPQKMSANNAQKIAWGIKQSHFVDDSDGADLFLSEKRHSFLLKFIIKDTKVLADSLVMVSFKQLEQSLNYTLLMPKKIIIELTDENLLNTYKLPELDDDGITFLYEPLKQLKSYSINKLHTIYYNTDMPIDEVKKVEIAVKHLRGYFPNNQRIDIVFLNNGTGYVIKLFVVKKLWYNLDVTSRLKSAIVYMQDSGLKKTVKLVLIDPRTFEETQITDHL